VVGRTGPGHMALGLSTRRRRRHRPHAGTPLRLPFHSSTIPHPAPNVPCVFVRANGPTVAANNLYSCERPSRGHPPPVSLVALLCVIMAAIIMLAGACRCVPVLKAFHPGDMTISATTSLRSIYLSICCCRCSIYYVYVCT